MDRTKENVLMRWLFAVLALVLEPIKNYAEMHLVFYAYKGTTELSSAQNPPRAMMGANLWGKRSTAVISSSKVVGQNLWLYNTTDGSTEIISNTYFTDGFYLGMREGDLIFGSICTGTSATMFGGIIGPVTTAGCGIASTNGYISSTR